MDDFRGELLLLNTHRSFQPIRLKFLRYHRHQLSGKSLALAEAIFSQRENRSRYIPKIYNKLREFSSVALAKEVEAGFGLFRLWIEQHRGCGLTRAQYRSVFGQLVGRCAIVYGLNMPSVLEAEVKTKYRSLVHDLAAGESDVDEEYASDGVWGV